MNPIKENYAEETFFLNGERMKLTNTRCPLVQVGDEWSMEFRNMFVVLKSQKLRALKL